MTTWLAKQNRRAEGTEATISSEAHTIGEDDANWIYLNEVPVAESPSSVSIPGYTEVVGAPAALQFRVYYQGRLAGAIEFNAANNGAAIAVGYKGRGSTYFARDFNRLQIEKVDRDGSIPFTGAQRFPAGTAAAPGVAVGEAATGLFRPAVGVLGIAAGGVERGRFDATGLTLPTGHKLAFASAADLLLGGGAAGRLDLVSASGAQDLLYRIENTAAALANLVGIALVTATREWRMLVGGTGHATLANKWALRDETAGANRLIVDTSGHLLFGTDNTQDIGASGATRPRTGYFGASVIAGTDPGGTGAFRATSLSGQAMMAFKSGGDPGLISLAVSSEALNRSIQLNFVVNVTDTGNLSALARITAIITQADPSALKGQLNFYVNSGDNLLLAAVLSDAGIYKIGGTAVRATTEGTRHLDIFDGTAPVGTLANGISLYSTAGELRVMDAAGNATLLSPHDERGEWVYYSKHSVTGRVLRVRMERLVKFLNDKYGLDFVDEFLEAAR